MQKSKGGKYLSHPSRVRGLKCFKALIQGAGKEVAPFAGAWIEIKIANATIGNFESHPSRVRGLKSYDVPIAKTASCVAPFAGAWIEI